MNQRTLIALAGMAVIAVLAFATLRAPPKGEHVGPRERPIPALKADAVKELELSANNGKDKTTLKLEGAQWKLTAPGTYPADQSQVKTAIEQLEKVRFGDLVTEKKEKLGDLEVSDDKGAHVIARGEGGKVLLDGWIGKSVSGFTMLRPAGKDQVWQASGLFKYTYAKDSKSWRDHSMLSFQKDDVSRLALEANGQKLVLDKVPPAPDADKDRPAAAPPPEPRWKVAETTVKVDPLDDSVANGMVTALSTLAAADFDDGANAGEAGLTHPKFRVTATIKGQPATLLLGGQKGDDMWAQVEGKGQIYLLHKYAIERVAVKPVDFRDKTLVKAKEGDLQAVDIVQGGQTTSLEKSGAAWQLAKASKGEIDDGKARSLVGAFDDLKGSSFAETTDAATTGLAKPQGTVTLHLRDGGAVVLKVGNANKDQTDYFVQKAGSPDVMMVKKYQVDRFLKKTADLTKTEAPAK